MISKILKPAFLLGAILALSSCGKEDIEPAPDPGGGGTTSKGNFSWTINNTTTTADSSVCYLQFTTIYAYKSGTLTTVEINLSDMATGTYVISSTTGNEIKYTNSSGNFSATSGTVNLTNNANGKMSGQLNCAFSSTAVPTLSAQFSEVPIR